MSTVQSEIAALEERLRLAELGPDPTFFEESQKTMAEFRAAREANDQAKLDALKPAMDAQRA